ncbi:MAG: preprotein translocase subunit SecY [candidate division Zixibacteria bacterium SM23_81]|nr:MAG: preprotein translocase subunit SecY [candidate division Zixibacteria bacterium SM23_81]
MIKSIQSIFKIPELRRRLLFTLAIFFVYRIGGHVPTPGINAQALGQFFSQASGTLFGLYDMFVGGSFKKMTIFGLGIMPYISASIILQLLGSVVPYFQKLQKEGEEGRRKITQYTRYGTVVISALQAYGISVFLESITTQEGQSIVLHPGFGFRLLTMLTLCSGTIFIMWLGEQITERGIGNGISLIIFIGIIARLPGGLMNEIRQVLAGTKRPVPELFLVFFLILAVAAVVFITQGRRRVPVQYAKRVIGRKMYGGQSTHIPLSVNSAGVIPIIFASSIMMAPRTVTTFFPNSTLMQTVGELFSPSSILHMLLFGLLIIFFAYFYTAIVINPIDMADNMRKYGGFIPGVRPGRKTAEYIDRVMTRITLPGAIFFALIAVMPLILMRSTNIQFYFGGTSLIIVVGVAIDTLQQIESHLLMRHYDGFLKRGKLRSRR